MTTTTNILPHLRLLHNIQHADYEDCWREGYEQGTDSETDAGQNPFAEGSQEHQYWDEGWWAAYYGEEPIFATQHAENRVQVAPQVFARPVNRHSYPFIRRVVQLSAAILLAMACYELADLAI